MAILESLALLQKEKLSVIKKELLHLHNIANFYSGGGKGQSSLTQQRDKMAQIICIELETHLSRVSKLFDNINQNERYLLSHPKNLIPFLARYDQSNLDIRELLKLVSFIQSKLSQFLQDGFNHYIPIPMTSKRYSSKGFLDYLKSYYEEILTISSDAQVAEEISPLIFWGHNISFTAEKPKYENNARHYIETAYWNYEIPVLLPAMSHELGHILLNHAKKSKENKLSPLYNYMLQKLEKSTPSKESSLRENNKSNIFLDEIVSDIFAYMTLGDSYVLTMAHEFLGKGFARMFLVEDYEGDIEKDLDIDFNTIDTGHDLMVQSLARLLILLDFSKGNKKEELSSHVDEIDKILKHIVPHIEKETPGESLTLKEAKKSITEARDYHSLQEYYAKSHPNFWKDYDKFHASVFMIVNEYREIIDSKKQESFDKFYALLDNAILKIGSENNEIVDKYEQIFSSLWKARLGDTKCSIVKNLFRKLILRQDQTIKDSDFGEAYELTFFKTRTDFFNDLNGYKNMFESLSYNIMEYYVNPTPYIDKEKLPSVHFCFDLFNAVLLQEKKEHVSIGEMNTFLESRFFENKKPFYTYKHSLIRIDSDSMEKEAPREFIEKYNFLIQIQLVRNDSKYTQKALTRIKEFIKTSKNDKDFYYETFDIFKSLGPKELVLNFTNINFYSIQHIKSNLLLSNDKELICKRSYSTIYGDFNNLIKIDETSKYNISSTLRLKVNASNQKFQNILSEYSNKIDSYRTIGVTDITIIWNLFTSIESVFSLYDKLIKDKFTSDIQTKINENYSPVFKEAKIPHP